MLSGYLRGAGDDGFRPLKVDYDRAPLESLDHAADQLPYPFGVLLVDGFALGLTDLLDEDLLGDLRSDPAQHLRLNPLAVPEGHKLAAFAVYLHGDVLCHAEVVPGR